MKERIDAESRDEYVYYRIQRALETLEEAEIAGSHTITRSQLMTLLTSAVYSLLSFNTPV